MGATRYYGEQDPRHRGPLQWPGVNGYPFRGPVVPLMKAKEIEQLATSGVVGDSYHRTFDLADDRDSRDYAWVRERIRNGWFTQDFVKRWQKGGSVHVYLEWTQIYVEMPKGSPGVFSRNPFARFSFHGAG